MLFGEIFEPPPSFPHDSGGNPEVLRYVREKTLGSRQRHAGIQELARYVAKSLIKAEEIDEAIDEGRP